MFLMKASEKVTTANAYVTGIGSDQTGCGLGHHHATDDDPADPFVFGHEMGHYMLHHIPQRAGLRGGIAVLRILHHRIACSMGSCAMGQHLARSRFR